MTSGPTFNINHYVDQVNNSIHGNGGINKAGGKLESAVKEWFKNRNNKNYNKVQKDLKNYEDKVHNATYNGKHTGRSAKTEGLVKKLSSEISWAHSVTYGGSHGPQ